MLTISQAAQLAREARRELRASLLYSLTALVACACGTFTLVTTRAASVPIFVLLVLALGSARAGGRHADRARDIAAVISHELE